MGWIASFLVPFKHWLGLMLLAMFHCSPIYASLRCPLQRDACSFGQMHGPELPTVQLRKMVRNAIMTWVSFKITCLCGSKKNSPKSHVTFTIRIYHLRLRSELGRTLCSPRCMNSVPPWLLDRLKQSGLKLI